MTVPRHRRETLITALLASKSLVDAARKSGMSLRSVHRALKNEDFLASYHDAQRALLQAAVNKLRVAAVDFATTLHKVCMNPKAPSGSRAMAASRGLELLGKFTSFEELERRVLALEAGAATIERRR